VLTATVVDAARDAASSVCITEVRLLLRFVAGERVCCLDLSQFVRRLSIFFARGQRGGRL
jgi:hypothetical protein